MTKLGSTLISLVALAACSTVEDPAPGRRVGELLPASSSGVADPFDLALRTVDHLVEAGNEQKAIDRLTQLLGQATLSSTQQAEILAYRARLRGGAGHDLEGAVSDYDRLISRFSETAVAGRSAGAAAQARLETALLLDQLERGDLTPTEMFEVLFRLGRHQDAADLMLHRNLKPDDPFILDMYQIGFLCSDPGLTGPDYDVTAPDGAFLRLKFCDFGK